MWVVAGSGGVQFVSRFSGRVIATRAGSVLLVGGSKWRLVWVLWRWRAAGGVVSSVRRLSRFPGWGERVSVADRLEVWAAAVDDPGLWADVLVAAGWLRDWRHDSRCGCSAKVVL